jgi:hypothetical protein
MKRFFKILQESTIEGTRAAAKEMKKYAKRQIERNQRILLFYSLNFLIRSFDSEMLSWPNSPFLVMLQFVDPNNVLSRDEHERLQEGEEDMTPFHHLAHLADCSDYSTHVNQLILVRQSF